MPWNRSAMACHALASQLPPARRPAPAAGVGRWGRLAAGLFLFVTIAGSLRWLAARNPEGSRAAAALLAARRQVNVLLVAFQRGRAAAELPAGYVAARSSGLTLYYPPGAEDEAAAVETLVRRYSARLAAELDAPVPGPVTVVISPSREDMAGFLGARFGSTALGAYWRGVIWVLSPREWLDAESPGWQRRFEEEGPVVHELAHQVLDERTAGNLPGWWDEGVAQYAEYRLTGFQWVEPASRLGGGMYSLDDLLDRFDTLPSEALAYRQAFLLVRYLVETYGADVIPRVNSHLALGRSGRDALAAATGVAPRRLEQSWRSWLAGVERAERESAEQDSTDSGRNNGANDPAASAR